MPSAVQHDSTAHRARWRLYNAERCCGVVTFSPEQSLALSGAACRAGAASPSPVSLLRLAGIFGAQGLREGVDRRRVHPSSEHRRRRSVRGRTSRAPAPELATQLVALKPSVIVAPGTPAAVAAKQASGTIPIVFVGVADAVGSGLAAHFGRPTRTSRALRARAPSSMAHAWNFSRRSCRRRRGLRCSTIPATARTCSPRRSWSRQRRHSVSRNAWKCAPRIIRKRVCRDDAREGPGAVHGGILRCALLWRVLIDLLDSLLDHLIGAPE